MQDYQNLLHIKSIVRCSLFYDFDLLGTKDKNIFNEE